MSTSPTTPTTPTTALHEFFVAAVNRAVADDDMDRVRQLEEEFASLSRAA